MSKISVIVPIYNAEKYLHRCIDSILAQIFTDFELLLINDGSKDRSGAICDEYAVKDSRVRVFHKENGGVSSARNLGLDNAKGEWIAFCDADDYVLPTYLVIYMGLSQNNPELCILGLIPDYSISEDYKITQTSFNYNVNVQDFLPLFYKCQMAGSISNKLFNRFLIKENQLRFNETFKYREDEDFLLRYMFYVRKVAATCKSGYVYVVPKLSKYNGLENLQSILSMYKSVVKIYVGKANEVTDSYQIELSNEWLSLLKIDNRKAIKKLPQVLAAIGLRIFRVIPLKASFHKIYVALKKHIYK